jgi:hypothetical protein
VRTGLLKHGRGVGPEDRVDGFVGRTVAAGLCFIAGFAVERVGRHDVVGHWQRLARGTDDVLMRWETAGLLRVIHVVAEHELRRHVVVRLHFALWRVRVRPHLILRRQLR